MASAGNVERQYVAELMLLRAGKYIIFIARMGDIMACDIGVLMAIGVSAVTKRAEHLRAG